MQCSCPLQVQEAVYMRVLAAESFEQILGTRYQEGFVAYCVQMKNIDTLLVFAIKHKK